MMGTILAMNRWNKEWKEVSIVKSGLNGAMRAAVSRSDPRRVHDEVMTMV